MSKFQCYVGIDVGSREFTASIYLAPGEKIQTMSAIANEPEGFDAFEQWLQQHGVKPENCVICMEATGVYGEQLAYWLRAKGYSLAIEPPLKVKRAFSDKSHKNDRTDSRQIAEYAYRFVDELRLWQPRAEVLEQLNVLLMTREQLVHQRTAQKNTLKMLSYKVVQTPLANRIYQENIERLTRQIKQIEQEIKKLIDKHPDFKQLLTLLLSIPGVGLLLAANLLVVTNGFKGDMAVLHRKLSAYIGICPYEHTSGSSVYRRPRIAHYGPAQLRKLLHLAARSVVTHKQQFRQYYLRKQQEGKAPKLVLNNVANKLLRIICAVTRDRRPYNENHVSVHPKFLQLSP